MQYISKNQDDTIAVITLFPLKIIENKTGNEIIVIGQKRKDPKNGELGKCIIYGELNGEGVEIVVGDENYNIADLSVDSINGYTIVFPDIETDIIGKWVKESKDKVVSHRILNKNETLPDRYFRNAWKDDGSLTIDMPKAKEIHRDKLRRLRIPILETLDIEYQKADEIGDTKKKKEIADKKQALRDITIHPDIDNATTPEQLKVAAIQLLQ